MNEQRDDKGSTKPTQWGENRTNVAQLQQEMIEDEDRYNDKLS